MSLQFCVEFLGKALNFGLKLNFSVVHSFPCFVKGFGGNTVSGLVLVFWWKKGKGMILV